ncbi:LacI family DNA-binding transcriptional regulator [Pleomorphomonas sp. NRK KF1]|uniref:LacI family DNA-binding transcriptional regulator n=1 Tax=Pleomorphomonas sp. NRK KF1 TaxID=2943000 RepID=UPI00204333A3|nr:LacI family DNA-binding transcriptional regulator [Pleomorphomonas sp. NRK KF1]MCM5552948.1 LacI family transcriptional regulator [Pleomorphomonas sp. NRK KF1]
MVTLSEVAREAGVSPTAVSRHLNRSIVLPKATADRIDEAVGRLGYRPNALAKRLSKGKAEAICLATPEISNPFFAELASAIESAAAERGYGVTLLSTRGRPAREIEAVNQLADRYFDGLIMIAARPDDGTLGDLIGRRQGIVLLDEDVPAARVPRIFVENAIGARLATEHLIAMGHTDIALIAGPMGLLSANERVEGFKATMAAHGLRVDEARMLHGEFTREFGHEAALAIARMSPRPTAILACSDYLSVGVLGALHDLGLSVPDDISLVGFDDMPLAELFDPPLTTIRQPIAEMGRIALERLLASLDGVEVPAMTRLPVELIVRKSVADIRGNARR